MKTTKAILPALLLVTMALTLPTAQANPIVDYDDGGGVDYAIGAGGENPCNGMYDEDCTCDHNVSNCERGNRCGKYIDPDTGSDPDGMCIDGRESMLLLKLH